MSDFEREQREASRAAYYLAHPGYPRWTSPPAAYGEGWFACAEKMREQIVRLSYQGLEMAKTLHSVLKHPMVFEQCDIQRCAEWQNPPWPTIEQQREATRDGKDENWEQRVWKAEANLASLRELLASGSVKFSRNRGEPDPTPAFPTHVEFSMKNWDEILKRLEATK